MIDGRDFLLMVSATALAFNRLPMAMPAPMANRDKFISKAHEATNKPVILGVSFNPGQKIW